MLKRRVAFIIALACLANGALNGALAAPSACPQHFLNGEAPDLVNPALAAQTRELCYTGFAVRHSGLTRTPLWSAEHLTRDRVDAARGLERHNTFHAEPRLPAQERAELADYARSGFDRGHMAPSGDMPDEASQNESFSLANMIPQNPDNNRNLWEGIESTVRDLARQDGELYVITGPLFQGQMLQRLHGRVLVPTAIFKAVYDPTRHQAAAYVVPNTEGNQWQAVSLAQLEKMSGIDVFPSLPQPVKDSRMALPPPTSHGHSRQGHADGDRPDGNITLATDIVRERNR